MTLDACDAVVVGAGFGGLAACATLCAAGAQVALVEQHDQPGGKAAGVWVNGTPFDSGPTVLTWRSVVESLFDDLKASPPPLTAAELIARHHWPDGSLLDLFGDVDRSADAIRDFAGPGAARQYRRFCDRSAEVFRTLRHSFIEAGRPNPLSLSLRVLREQGPAGLGALWRIQPFRTLWSELSRSFEDPRLRQLYARYATYCGTSPLDAPATLMLVAHVERQGVWQVQGGLRALAQALASAARGSGRLREHYGVAVKQILHRDGRVQGVQLADGQLLRTQAVVFCGDATALADGLLGQALRPLARRPASRSLSAVTWHFEAVASGWPLSHHNVLFGPVAGYADEFTQITAGGLPTEPTVYLCAQDRGARAADPAPHGAERLMALVNAPAAGGRPLHDEEIAACEHALWHRLRSAGLKCRPTGPVHRTTPLDFARRFPGSAGALYGPASKGWLASFLRPSGRTRLPGLYLAGGSVHPGPGVPMAMLSGRWAAHALLADRPSTWRWQQAAMPGGISMR
jgi:1-hydroxycarotenoid 3,4-desaturase